MKKEILQFNQDGSISRQMMEFDDTSLTQLQVTPELLQVVQGYTNGDQIAGVLYRDTPVGKEAGIFPAFGTEGWNLADAERQLRGAVQHVDVAVGNVTYLLKENALGFMIDRRELQNYAMGEDELSMIRTNMVNAQLAVKDEYDAALIATATGSYDAAVSGAGYDWASAGKPVDHILAQKEVVRQAIGAYPDTAVFDPTSWKLFRTNENVRSYLSKYTAVGSSQAVTISEQLAADILEVKTVKVGRMVMKNAAGTVSDIWSVNQSGNVVLAYTGTGIATPTYGFKFKHRDYPIAEMYWSSANKSNVYDIQNLYQYKITLKKAGQLIYSIA